MPCITSYMELTFIFYFFYLARSTFVPLPPDFDVHQHPDEIEVTIGDKSPVPHSDGLLWGEANQAESGSRGRRGGEGGGLFTQSRAKTLLVLHE